MEEDPVDAWVVDHFGKHCPALELGLDRVSAAIVLLVGAGMKTREQVVLFLCLARMPNVLAEAAEGRKRGFLGHPGNLPAFSYEKPEEADGSS
jgi:hypothetical protein